MYAVAAVAVPISAPTSTTSTPSEATKNALSPVVVTLPATAFAASVACPFAGNAHVYVPASMAIALSPLCALERLHFGANDFQAGHVCQRPLCPNSSRSAPLNSPCLNCECRLCMFLA